MAKHTVNIELRSGGGSQVAGEFGKVGKASTDLIVNIKKIGQSFGDVGGKIGGFVQNILKGGIWSISHSIVELGLSAIKGLISNAGKASEELRKAQEDVVNAQVKQLDVLAGVHKRMADERRKAIEESTKQYAAELDAVHNLTRATLELERARARKNGSGVEAIDAQIDMEYSANARAKLERALSDAEERKKAAASSYNNAVNRGKQARDLVESLRYDLSTETDKEVRKTIRKNIGRTLVYGEKTENDAAKERERYDKAVAEAERAKKALAAFDIREQANAENRKQDAREKEAEEVKKFEAEKKKLEQNIAAERRKLESDAIKERERLEKEAHQRRMADIREEIAEQGKAAGALRSVAASAQSEFDKAFAMYRDPSRAEAEIGEEKAYRSDLDRLHKDARRYGGKWRIDELSALMAAGDTQGVSDTLASWRKSKGFTPEVEAMVRASAAENVKTTAEDELRKLNDRTNELSQKLELLAQSRDAKLDGIERNTNQLANKIDELLTVKG